MSLTIPIIKNITQYLPETTTRLLSKQFLSSHDYCQLAASIYQDDMMFVKNHFKDKAVFYYNNETLYAQLNSFLYKVKQVDDYYIIIIKNKIKDMTNIVTIDLLSQYQIFKNRGCEDQIKNFSKINTLKILSSFFKNYFNPDQLSDLLYLYVFLHASCVLLNYTTITLDQQAFKINKLPSQDFLNQIYDLYNLLYVHFDVLED